LSVRGCAHTKHYRRCRGFPIPAGTGPCSRPRKPCMCGNYEVTVHAVAPPFDKSLPTGTLLICDGSLPLRNPRAPAQKNTRSSKDGCVSARNAHCTRSAVSSTEGGRDIDSLEGVLVKSRSGWCGVVARRYFDSTRVAAAIVLATCFVATPARGQTPAPAEAP